MSERAPDIVPEARHEAARTAVSGLAPALGLAPEHVDLRLDREGDRLLADAGARGAARGNVVWLRDFDPRASASRLTLAHELVHVAQARLPSDRPHSRRAAEREAERLAEALVAGGMVPLPRAAVGDALHFDGEDPPRQRSLDDLVRESYRDECDDMDRLLEDEEPSSGNVTRVLEILAPLQFETAAALAGCLAAPRLAALANGLGEDHALGNRREVLAAASNFTAAMLAANRNGLRIFEHMRIDLVSFTPAEQHAAVTTLRAMPEEDLARLDASDNGPAFRTLRTSPLPEYDRDEAQARAARIEARRRGVGIDLSRLEDDLHQALSAALARIDRAHAQRALEMLAENPALAVPDPRFSGAPAPGRDDPLPALPEASLQNVIARLDNDGLVARWIGALEPEDRAGDAAVARGFAALVRARRPDRNIARLRQLFSTGFWDWAVRDWEARLGWDILRNMPPAEQVRFQTLDDGRLYLRLIEELPDDLRGEAGMAGLILVRGEDGSLTDLTGSAAALLREQEDLIRAFRAFDGSHEQAYELFVRLVALGAPAPASTTETARTGTAGGSAPGSTARPAPSITVLQAVVHRLDVLGLIGRLFEGLSDGVKQDRRYWNDIALVLGARDPVFSRADLRRLLHVSSFLWIFTIDSVSFEEALFAFHVLRVLPPDQRHAFELEDGGSYAGRLAGSLSQSMMQEAGLSFAFTRPDERGETPLRRQLADPAAWSGENPQDLALMIQMDIAAGDFDWVFEQSRRQRAWTVEALGTLVDRFALYDPRVGRTFPRPHTVSAARASMSYLGMLFGTGAYELEMYTRPVQGVDPFTGEPTTYAETTGVRMTVDLEQLERNAGAPLSAGMVLARTPGERTSIGMDNRETALGQPNVIDIELNEPAGFMRVRASRINLARFASVSTGSTLRTGPISVSDLDFELTFMPEDMRSPRGGRFHMNSASIDEIVYTGAGQADVTGLRHLGIDGVDASATFQTAPLPDSPVLGHVFGLLWDLVLNRDQLTDSVRHRSSLGNATIKVGRIDAQGLRMGDIRLASLSVQGITVAAAGNRAAHLRAQIFVLDSRIERARRDAPDSVADLLAEQQQLRTRLRELEPLETELLLLMGKVQTGQRLTETEQRRLDQLQSETGVGAAGGLAVYIASFSIDELDGPVRLGHASLTNIHGGGESAALAFQQLTSAEAIRRFVTAGTPARSRFGAGMADQGMSFTADDFSLRDLSLPATIPTLAEIEDRLRAAPPPPLAERNHLQTLLPLVRRYESLRALSLDTSIHGAAARSPQDQRELLEVSRQLGEILDIRVREVTVTHPIVSIGENEGMVSAGAIAGRIEARGIRAGGYTIDSIDALHPSGALVLTADSVGDVTGSQVGEQFHARIAATELTIRGIHGPGIADREGQSLTLSGIHAYLRMDTDGLHIEGLAVRQLDIQALEYNNGTHHLWSTNPSSALDITADILIRRREDGAAGFGGLDYRNIHIETFRIGRVEGAGLGYERLEGGTRKFVVEIESGALLGIALSNFDIDMRSAETQISGGVSIDGFDQTRFRFAMRDMLEAHGQLDRAVTSTPGVRVGMATDGTQTIDLDALVATDTDVTYHGAGGSGGGLHITRGDLSGQIVMQGNDIRLNSLRLESIEFSRINWRTAGGTTIRADGPTTATGVRFSGRYSTLDDTRSEFAIDSLHVDRITAAHIVVDAGSLHLELPEPRPGGGYAPGDAATLTGIDISNLLIGMDGGATRIGPTPGNARAHGSIATTSANFLAQYTTQLRASGMLQAGQIDFWFDPGNVIEARATGLSGAGVVRYGSGALPGTGARDTSVETGFGFSGLDSGLIRYAGNVVSIGANGGAPLHMDRLTLSQLELAGPSMEIYAPDTSDITATNIGARMEVHLHPDAAAAAAAGTPYERIVINELTVGNLAASGMRIHLKNLDLWLDLPMDEVFNVGPILVGGPADPVTNEPLTIEPGASGTAITGRVRAEALRGDRLQAQLVGTLNARMNFAADALEANFAGNGPMSVDLLNWSATQISGYVMGDPDQRIRLRAGPGGTRHDLGGDTAGIGADRLSYNEADGGHVFVSGLNARGMRYDDDAAGIHLDIRRIDAPDVAVDLGGTNGGRRIIEIPSATITDAWFRMDRISSGSGSSSASRFAVGNAAAAWLAANHALFQNVNGNFAMRGAYGVDGAIGIPGFDYTFNFNVPITNGAINYRDLEGQIPNLVDAAVDFHLEGSTLYIGAGFHIYPPGDPESMEPPPDPIPVYKNFFEWNLDSGHLAQVQGGQIDFDTLLRAEASGAPSAPGGTDYIAPLMIDQLSLGLSIDNGADLPVSLGSMGTATLAPHALSGLSVTGALQPLPDIFNAYPSLREQGITNPNRPGGLLVSLDHFNLSSLDLRFPTRGRGSRDVRTGEVHVGRIANAEIGFSGLSPRTAEGTLTEASVSNLVVTISPDRICPIPETPTPRRAGAPALDSPGTFRPLDDNGRPVERRP
ncbi:protein of unknown function [Novosphingobium sp. CF614]|uniref:eCIS core domain-containing protein n=1 Tax=Novosphingobium sp. CF614 TaxID=1884364 RepID=UPI0008EF38DC|nr:DUF4157 domain-containing protein [Novosphingobium sp. CF614]SFF76407.1 protein of unknown function [Novosphingobium sp. CF614]